MPALLTVTLVEALLRQVLVTRPDLVFVAAIGVGALWFRRTQPLLATAVAFGVAAAATLVEMVARVDHLDLSVSACVLLLPYSLLRWGSGREAAIGLCFMTAAYGVSALNGELRGTDAIGAAVVMLFPAALGVSVRFRAHAHDRALEHARLREREHLARELHDSVAHHITAIVLQAQAAGAVMANRPEAAVQSLKAIEDEAKRTLTELREVVGALRDRKAAELAPQSRISDLEQLARGRHESLPIEVELVGDLGGLRPSLESAIYRLAQEAITNALRHARRASRVLVRVEADAGAVRLTVQDDGEGQVSRGRAGFGLVGMAERATLFGGTFEAGACAQGGWRVEAVLPRQGIGR